MSEAMTEAVTNTVATNSAIPNQYVCELCKKEFGQKIDYTRHKNKKSPCISIEQIQSRAQVQETNTDVRRKLATVFKYCLDVLRNNEHLTGDKALRTLAHLLDLRLLEPQFGTQIDIDTYTGYSTKLKPESKEKLLYLARFSNLAKQKEDNIPTQMKHLWDEILSVHPITKHIFLKGKGFDIQHQSTYKKLIDKLFEFKFETMDEDILGEAYEEVIKDVMIGKTLGQFFTPPNVKQMMVDLIDPQIKTDGTVETVFDPAMGTGGFLITCLRHLIKKSKTLDITLNWDHVINHGLGGREPEPDTYQLAVSNMLIASGHMFNTLEKGDSIRNPITNKYDIILANPPFGIDGLKYFEIVDSLRNEYLPISSNSAVPLFIQAIVYMLNIGGRCAVVLPEGQELFSKNKGLVAVREFLMKTCDLKEVIYLPAGTFTHTSIKTCVLYFHKKKEGKDIVTVNVKYSATTQQETQRDYVFSKTHQTHTVKFYDYNPSNGVKHLLIDVNISDIAKQNYSLNYATYLKDETVDAVYEEGVVVKTLGEVCEFINGYAFKSSEFIGNLDGTTGIVQIKAIQNGYIDDKKITEYINTDVKYKKYEVFTNDILIALSGATTGKIGIYYSNKTSYLNQRVAKLICKTTINHKYLYYWYILSNIEQKVNEQAQGTAQPNISTRDLENIKIPIPPIEKQTEIVKYMDFIYEKCIKSSNEKIQELKQLNEYCLTMQKDFGLNVIKPLSEICNVDYGTRIVKANNIEGSYPVYGSGKAMFNTNTFNREGFNVLIGRFALSQECVRLISDKLFLNDSGLSVKPKNTNMLLHKFIAYYLYLNQNIIYNCARGTAQKNLDMDAFKAIKIPIPSLKRQKEIVEYCEYNDMVIKQLEREIEQNKKQAQMFLANIIKVVGTNPQPESTTVLQSSTDSQSPPENTTTTDTGTHDDAVSVTSSTGEDNQETVINPEHFTPEYLAQKSVSDLKQMKKTHKIRAKVTGETVEEYARIIQEWYTKRTSKPAKKKTTPRRNAQNIAVELPVLALDLTVPE
jgi:type I restriction enzyme S subunit